MTNLLLDNGLLWRLGVLLLISFMFSEEKTNYSYDNFIGGLYLKIDSHEVFSVNISKRVKGRLSLGGIISYFEIDDSIYKRKNYQSGSYLSYDILNMDKITLTNNIGISYTRQNKTFTYNDYELYDEFYHLGFGALLNIKLVKKIGVGFGIGLVNQTHKGESIQLSGDWYFMPAFMINLYDIF
jgi:hypothetical protein